MLQILLPSDFSENAKAAAMYAIHLFSRTKCKFYVLHSIAVPTSPMINLSSKLEDTLREQAQRELTAVIKELKEICVEPQCEIHTILSNEQLHVAVERAVIQYSIDFVVMGTKGATAAKRILWGSNTVKTIRKMNACPLLIVPDKYEFNDLKQIAFPSDFNRFYNYKELKPIIQLAKLHDSTIRVVHIDEEDHLSDLQIYNKTILDDLFMKIKHSFHWLTDEHKKRVEINHFVEDKEIDMLAMVRYNHGFMESILNEPVIKRIGFHPIVPFLVIPD